MRYLSTILSFLMETNIASAIKTVVPMLLLFLVIIPLLFLFAPQVLQAWKDYQEFTRYEYGVNDGNN